jgi:Cytotoxic translational repressor of toxin-antitoxin stability system
MFEIIVHKRALKYLNKLSSFRKTKIKELLTELINNPIQREDVKPMLGEWKGYYRIRIGNIRLIFWVDELIAFGGLLIDSTHSMV